MKDFYKHITIIILIFISWLGLAQLKDPLIMILAPLYLTILVAGLYLIKYYENTDLSLDILKKERLLKLSIFILGNLFFRLLGLHKFLAPAFSIVFYLFLALFLLQALLFHLRIKRKEAYHEQNN